MYKISTMNMGRPPRYARKLLLLMQLTVALLIASMLQVSAAGYAQKVSLSEKHASLESIFNRLRSESGYDFLYNKNLLKKANPVNIHVKDVSIQDALEQCFSGQPFTFIIKEKTIIVKEKEKSVLDKVISLFADIDVRGSVKDETGKPLPGALIRIIGGEVATMAGNKGEFFIRSVPEGSKLAISFIGYATDTINVSATSNYNINLRPLISSLKEVSVVYSTGYQKIAKERATGSFAKPDMATFSQRTASQDIMARLDGLVPGLTVISGGAGLRGNDQTGRTQRSLIRGTGSVRSDTDPLYVVNGMVISNFATINPDDVEDITVLKDAAAAAIWGAKAANGVIVVTTKSGSKNNRVNVNYSGYVNFQGLPDFDYMGFMNSQQYIQTAKELFNPTAYPSRTLSGRFVAPHERLMYNNADGLISDAAMNAGLDSLAGINNRNHINDLFYRNSVNTNHTVSLSGGSKSYAAYSSVSYTSSTGNRPGASNKTYKLNLNQTYTPTKFLNLSLFAALNNNDTKANNLPAMVPDVLPYQLFKNADGSNITMNYVKALDPESKLDWEQRSRINLDYTPLDEVNLGFDKANSTSINLIGGLGIKIWKGLAFQGNYGFNKSPQSSENYSDHQTYSMRMQLVGLTVAPTAASTPIYYLPTTGGMYRTGDYQRKDWTVRNQLTYNSRVRDGKDYLSIQVGQEAQEQYVKSVYNTLMGYDLDLQSYAAIDYQTLGSTGIPNVVTGGRGRFSQQPTSLSDSKSRFVSYFALANYTFDGKYSLDLSWRQDKSTLVGSDQSAQDKPIYSIGAKWELTKEPFMENIEWLNNLGVRATYGITGNSPRVGASSSKDILELENTSTPPPAGVGAHVDSPGNTKLNWESARTINFGINFDVLNSRLSGTVDLYHKKTTRLLAAMILNPFVSFGSATGNLGELANKGIEIGLTSRNIVGRNFNWSSTLTFSYNHNKLLSYEENPIALSYATSKVAANYLIGYSMSSLFAYQYAGLDANGDPQVRLNDGTVTTDRNVASPEDIVYKGTTVPKFNGGILNNFNYKGFTLTANIGYNLGHVMRDEVNDFFTGRVSGIANGFGGNLKTIFLNRWKNTGDEAITNIPRYVAGNAANNRRELTYYAMGDQNVVSASYIKLRDVSLGYNIPPLLLNKVHIENMRVFFQANNFMLWKANKSGIDPEYFGLSTGSRSLPPFKHSFSVGANITF